jgi:Tfp pilus assembly protein PilF
LEKDPNYALAWAGLADTYSLMGEYTNTSRRDLFPQQMAAVNKALEIDNQLAEAHISLAISLMLNEWDWKNSEKEFNIGIELNPNYATGHHWHASWLLYNGKLDEAFKEISLAVELDPVSREY